MALGPCCTDLMKRRVELVEGWSRHVAFLLDLLYKLGALTEEDVDSVRGGGCRGERERMRRLLDVLHGRGEEACRAFQHALQQVSADPQPPPSDSNSCGQSLTFPELQGAMRKHKEILALEHSPMDYLSIRGRAAADGSNCTFIETTLLQSVGFLVPPRYQHEATDAGDAFRTVEVPPGTQGPTCGFSTLCQSLLFGRDDGVIFLCGVAGSGKTTLVRQLVHEWVVSEETQKVIISLSFRELNLVSEPQSLQDLLCVHYSHLRPVLAHILASDPSKILLILDGLDEFRIPLDFDRTPKCSDPELAQSMGSMVVNLIKGNLLPGRSLLLTSRPYAVTKVPLQLVSVFFTVLGFSPEQQHQYFLRTCQTAEAADVIQHYVSSHKPLLRMCHIPAFCWIVATALQNFSNAQESLQQKLDDKQESVALKTRVVVVPQGPGKPTTITEIYCCFLKAIIVFHTEGREANLGVNRLQEAPQVMQGMRSLLRDLGGLAFRGLLERRFLFDNSDLGSLALGHCELSRAFLVETLREDRTSLVCEKSFHFIHTSLQEFLAALYYVQQSLSGRDPFSGHKPGLLEVMRKALEAGRYRLIGPSYHRHIKKVFCWSESHQSGHLDLFCRFLSGLLVPSTRQILEGLFPQEPQKLLSVPACRAAGPVPPASAPPFFLKLLRSQLQHRELRPERQVNACHCLYEALDPGLPQRLERWLRLLAQQGEPALERQRQQQDWSELAFLLELSPALQDLNLEAQDLRADGLRRLLPVLHLFHTLRLAQNPLGPEGAAVLCLAVRNPDCRIEKLWLVATDLGCNGVEILSDALKENRTVVDLRMAINSIGDKGAGHLAELLRHNHTLRDIRLRDNHVTDKGAELLMAALKDNNTLEFLWLFDNKFSKDGVRKLKEFAKSRSTLDIKVCV
ncbi:protein NLRC3 [Paramormyrops kingsleyae]|uniref:protein NLRC3 n=1 Tax=Paramormyrops kingsleyae TaxID=1676925 RepID=UPI003B97B59D